MAEAVPAETERVKLTLANGALIEVPAYEGHQRGTNWMAVIDVDPTLPGGLSRRWLDRGKGECYYLVEQVGLFDPVEFGADYTTSVGTKKRTRWYGVVVAKTDDFLIIERCATGARAVIRSKAARVSPMDRVQALKVEQDVLIARAARVGAEMEDILKSSSPSAHASGADDDQGRVLDLVPDRDPAGGRG